MKIESKLPLEFPIEGRLAIYVNMMKCDEKCTSNINTNTLYVLEYGFNQLRQNICVKSVFIAFYVFSVIFSVFITIYRDWFHFHARTCRLFSNTSVQRSFHEDAGNECHFHILTLVYPIHGNLCHKQDLCKMYESNNNCELHRKIQFAIFVSFSVEKSSTLILSVRKRDALSIDFLYEFSFLSTFSWNI